MDQHAHGPAAGRAKHVSWHDHLAMLLHVGAEIEHGLMLQYHYAAYSIDVDGAPPEWRPVFRRWQDSVLATAKEEMGHLLTVRNALLLLGAPPNLQRRDFPWDVDYYPFPFRLEPFSPASVAVYLFTEMPSEDELRAAPRAKGSLYDWCMDTGQERMNALIEPRAKRGRALHRVDELYSAIIDLIADPDRIPDSAFREESYPAQARWDEWGRRYRPPPKTLTPSGSLDSDAEDAGSVARRNTNVLVAPVATRREAIDALCELSDQSEGRTAVKTSRRNPRISTASSRSSTSWSGCRAACARRARWRPIRRPSPGGRIRTRGSGHGGGLRGASAHAAVGDARQPALPDAADVPRPRPARRAGGDAGRGQPAREPRASHLRRDVRHQGLSTRLMRLPLARATSSAQVRRSRCPTT